jgi:hypothetical protein
MTKEITKTMDKTKKVKRPYPQRHLLRYKQQKEVAELSGYSESHVRLMVSGINTMSPIVEKLLDEMVLKNQSISIEK